MEPYLNKIEGERESTLETLKSWSNIHSGTHHLPGLALMLQHLKTAFSALGGIQKEISLPDRKILNIDGSLKNIPLGKMLMISKRPEAKIKILLAGHMDIAYASHLPLEPCRLTSRDILTGRGTADMKSGLLVMLLALKALESCPFSQNMGWEVLINPDEEIGSIGSKEWFKEAAKRCQVGLIFEPALPDGSLVSGRKGSTNFMVAVKGKAAHAGREFQKGHNAIAAAARFALAAEALSNTETGLTVNIGYMQGGGPLNIVPDTALCGINIRAKTIDDFKMTKEKIEGIMNLENQKEGIKFTFHEEAARAPKPFDEKTKNLFESLKECAGGLQMEITWKESGGVTDGNVLAEAGLPTVDTLGAVGGNLHTADEYVYITSLLMRAKLVAKFLMEIAAEKRALTWL